MPKFNYTLSWLAGIALLVILFIPAPAYAQWPPFAFDLNSSYADGKITYDVQFSKQVGWPMADVVFKIPLPEGTRFLEASAPSSTNVDFDGVEVTFFTPTLSGSLRDLSFVVEVTDPGRTEFTTHAWIAWKGEQPGDFLTGDAAIDISRTPLSWEKPSSRLRLEAGASVSGDEITYTIYPVNVGGRRMWDLSIALPLPPGTTFLSVEAPPPFEAGFDGQQANFSILELLRSTRIEPLRVKVSAAGVSQPLLVTQAWAAWTNEGRNVEEQGATKTGDIIVQPGVDQQVVADGAGDTPFPDYDLTSIAFREDGDILRTTFYTVDQLEPVGQPLEYFLYIDSDCKADTGKPRGNRGAEYWLRYRHQSGKAYIYDWDAVAGDWTNRRIIGAYASSGNSISGWIPYSLLDNNRQFCWLVAGWNRTEAYHPNPPIEWVGREPRLTQYMAESAALP